MLFVGSITIPIIFEIRLDIVLYAFANCVCSSLRLIPLFFLGLTPTLVGVVPFTTALFFAYEAISQGAC